MIEQLKIDAVQIADRGDLLAEALEIEIEILNGGVHQTFHFEITDAQLIETEIANSKR